MVMVMMRIMLARARDHPRRACVCLRRPRAQLLDNVYVVVVVVAGLCVCDHYWFKGLQWCENRMLKWLEWLLETIWIV